MSKLKPGYPEPTAAPWVQDLKAGSPGEAHTSSAPPATSPKQHRIHHCTHRGITTRGMFLKKYLSSSSRLPTNNNGSLQEALAHFAHDARGCVGRLSAAPPGHPHPQKLRAGVRQAGTPQTRALLQPPAGRSPTQRSRGHIAGHTGTCKYPGSRTKPQIYHLSFSPHCYAALTQLWQEGEERGRDAE